MAQSIYDVLETLQTVTSIKGDGEYSHSLPAELFPSPKVFESRDELLAWSEQHGYTQALLQAGLQKGLIDLRAKFRSCKKSETWTPEIGQKNINAHKWEVMTRPESAKSAEEKAIEALSKLSPEKIAAIMANLKK